MQAAVKLTSNGIAGLLALGALAGILFTLIVLKAGCRRAAWGRFIFTR